MRNIYLKTLLGIIGLLWLIYFLQYYTQPKKETFVQSMCRPYVRNINQTYDTFVNNYGPDVIMTKLKKWNIY
jgi:hypothetical protein